MSAHRSCVGSCTLRERTRDTFVRRGSWGDSRSRTVPVAFCSFVGATIPVRSCLG